jgi:hypothetical protein
MFSSDSLLSGPLLTSGRCGLQTLLEQSLTDAGWYDANSAARDFRQKKIEKGR